MLRAAVLLSSLLVTLTTALADDTTRTLGTASGVTVTYKFSDWCAMLGMKNTNAHSVRIEFEFDVASDKGSTQHEQGWIELKPGDFKGGGHFFTDDPDLESCPWVGEKQRPIRIFNFKARVRNLDAEEASKQAQEAEREQRRLAEQRARDAEREAIEARRREEDERRRVEDERRREEDARLSQEVAARDNAQADDGATEEATSSTGAQRVRSGSTTSSGTAPSMRQTNVPDAGQTAVTAGVTTALVGGAGLMVMGGMMDVKDGITPFEIGFGARVGLLRSGFSAGGALELRWLLMKEPSVRAGESLLQAQRRMVGHEIYINASIGGMFVSDCGVTCTTTAGRLLTGELGYRYWSRWRGLGAALMTVNESVSEPEESSGMTRPEGRPNTTLALEALAAFPAGRAARKIGFQGGLRLMPFASGAGLLFRGGINRMLIGLDFNVSDVGAQMLVTMGMRIAI